jgi:polyhydroxybutyrate depolymerase
LICDQRYSRYFRLQIPATYSAANATPIVFTLHGGGQTVASFAAEHPALFAKCNSEGVILVLPQALDHPVSRDTLWMNKPFDYVVDDRVFFTNLLEQIDAALNINRKRVYACGFSGGGSFSHWLAPICTQTGWKEPDANGPIVAPPAPLEAMPVMMVRGTNDATRPYYGGTNYLGNLCRSAADDVNYWTNGNSCAAAYSTTTSGVVTTYAYQTCAPGTEVVLVRIDGMPHIWPDAADGFGFDANDVVIDFLLRHARP